MLRTILNVLLLVGTAIILTVPFYQSTLPVPRVIAASEPARDFDSRSLDPINTLFGRTGWFASESASAFVQYDFGAPVSLRSIEHRYAIPAPDPWYQITGIRVLASDDQENWQPAGHASIARRADREAIGETMLSARAAARDDPTRILVNTGGATARYWRIEAQHTGPHRIDVFDKVSFIPSGQFSVPLELYAALLSLLLWRIMGWFRVLHERRGIVAVAVSIAATMVVGIGLLAPHWVVVARDSSVYLAYASGLGLSGIAPVGIQWLFAQIGVPNIPTAQLVIFYTSIAAAAILLHGVAPWIGFSVLMGAVVFSGVLIPYVFSALTETLFSCGLLLSAAGMARLLHDGARSGFVAAGFGLCLMMATKSISPVLVVAALISMLVIPPEGRRRYLAMVILPPIALWALQTSILKTANVTTTASQFAGYALLAQVAPLADKNAGGNEISEMEARIARVLGEHGLIRPRLPRSIAELDDFVDITSDSSNQSLALTVAEITRYLNERHPERYPRDAPQSVDLLTLYADEFGKLSHEILKREPLQYAAFVGAHFYGLWRDVGRAGFLSRNSLNIIPDVRDMALFIRSHAPVIAQQARIAAKQVGFLPDVNMALSAAACQANAPYVLTDDLTRWARILFRDYCPWLALVSVTLSLMILIPGVSHAFHPAIAVSLLLNSYFMGQAIFQVTIARYANVAAPTTILLILLTVYAIAKTLSEAMHRTPHPLDCRKNSAAATDQNTDLVTSGKD